MVEGAVPRFVGARVKRAEDPRLVTGRGTFVDDVRLPRMAHLAFLRSPHPHARIRSIDVSQVQNLPGVLLVRTGEELKLRCRPLRVAPPIQGLKPMESYPLAVDKVRFVGDPLVAVVAEDRYVAEDALERIQVEYEPLPPVVDAERAQEPGAPLVDETLGDNLVYHRVLTTGDVDRAFAEADRVIKETFRQHRYCHVPMETRGVVALWNGATGSLKVWASTQGPHLLRTHLSRILGLAEQKIQVQAQDVGGGFGQKYNLYREDVVVALMAMELERPVKWIEDRRENLTAASQAREDVVHVEMAVRNDGTLLGLKARIINDIGAYALYPLPSHNWASLAADLLPGPYKFSSYHREVLCVLTNKAPLGPYRAPWAVESWVREGMMDIVARELGLDPVEVRRKNMIRKEDQPYPSPGGMVFDGVTPLETLEKVVAAVDYQGFRKEQAKARGEGRYLGIGFGAFIEPTAFGSAFFASRGRRVGGHDVVTVRVEPTGKVKAYIGIAPHGQGHQTTMAQILADELGVPLEDITIVHGDTDAVPYGMGTFGSRSAVIGGGAMILAARAVREKVQRIAAHLLEVLPQELEVRNGVISVKGVEKEEITLAAVAEIAYADPLKLPPGMEPGLEATRRYDPPPLTFSNASHAAVVEVDPETGQVFIRRYVVCEDCGVMVNPMVVEGQICGGVVQGLGGVFLEHMVYDEEGQPLTTTFMDYLLPTAAEAPTIEIEHLETPSPHTLGGFKGMGEGGVLGSIAALCNAVADALSPLGVKVTRQPLSPHRVLQMMGAIQS